MEQRRKTSCDAPHEDGCRWADEAAERAVKKTFAILGVDIGNPESVETFREDLRFGKTLRKYTNKGIGAFVVALVCFLFAALMLGLREKLIP